MTGHLDNSFKIINKTKCSYLMKLFARITFTIILILFHKDSSVLVMKNTYNQLNEASLNLFDRMSKTLLNIIQSK